MYVLPNLNAMDLKSYKKIFKKSKQRYTDNDGNLYDNTKYDTFFKSNIHHLVYSYN